jgi:outer membrane protein OmpA-like peptidoglycan-associated protein
MKTWTPTTTLMAGAVSLLFLTACGPTLIKPDGAADARAKLTQLQADPQLASRAPVAIQEAETAVSAAEVPRKEGDKAKHLVEMANSKVDLARSEAQSRLLEDQRKGLAEDRETARLDSRTREADAAHSDAKVARMDADVSRDQADAANRVAAAATAQAADLKSQLAELNAKETDRGIVMTLGDVLFATGKSDLKGGAAGNLGKLAVFLNRYTDRTVTIEGYTDSVGSNEYNDALSQRRADSVKDYLVRQGVASNRLVASGKGEGSPIAGNDSATGREQNRRVEVVIANAVVSAK